MAVDFKLHVTRTVWSVIATVLLALASVASGGTVTWSGQGSDSNWSSATNWIGNIAPVSGDALIFDGGVGTSPNDDFATGTLFNGITFPITASSFTLSGNGITLGGDL